MRLGWVAGLGLGVGAIAGLVILGASLPKTATAPSSAVPTPEDLSDVDRAGLCAAALEKLKQLAPGQVSQDAETSTGVERMVPVGPEPDGDAYVRLQCGFTEADGPGGVVADIFCKDAFNPACLHVVSGQLGADDVVYMDPIIKQQLERAAVKDRAARHHRAAV